MDSLRRILAFLVIGVIAVPALESSVFAEGTGSPGAETDQVIVKMKEDKTGNLENSTVITELEEEEQLVTVKVPEDESMETFVDDLEDNPDVASVEPDHLMQLEYIPNDPYAGSRQYHHQKIGTNRAWDKTQGSPDLTIAVLDDGIDLNHDDLEGRIASFYDVVGASSSTIPQGEHGTHVAGIISSSMDNGFLGAGVAPNTEIMAINVFSGLSAYTSDIIEGIYHAVDNGAKIINLSVGNYIFSPSLDEAVQYAHNQNVLVIAAAGNASTNEPAYPASYENVVSVGATTENDRLSSFSNFGPTIDITAPGSGIYSTLPDNSFGPMSGTSMASPMVAGVAALIWDAEPHLSNEEVADRLYSTADDLGTPGMDDTYGNGRLNAKAALKILDLAAPEANAVTEKSNTVTGSIPYEIENASVTVYDQSGNKIAGVEGVTGPADFSIEIPLQKAGTVLFITAEDGAGNVSEPKEVIVQYEIKESRTSLLGHLDSTSVRIYGDYKDQSNYTKAGTKYTHTVYYIKKQAAFGNETYYLISTSPSSTRNVVGWVKSEDMTEYKHVGIDKTPKTFYIKGVGHAYDTAWGGRQNISFENLSRLEGEAFSVNLTERVGTTLWYRGVINGETAWIRETGLSKEPLNPAVESYTSRLGHLDSSRVRIYDDYQKKSEYVTAGSKYTHTVYYIKKQAAIGNELYYLISTSPSSTRNTVGWVKDSDMTDYKHVGIDKTPKTFYIKGADHAYDTAWGGRQNISFENLSLMKGEAFSVNLTERVGTTLWYRGVINGKTAWIRETGLSKEPIDAAVESYTSRLGHLDSSKVRIYDDYKKKSGYVTAGTKYTHKVYYIKKQAAIGEELYYLIGTSPSSTRNTVGWVNAEDMSTHPHVAVDKEDKTFYLKGTGSAYGTAWGGRKDFVFSDLSSYENQPFEVHLTEKVGNSIWHRGKLNGKTVWIHEAYISRTR